MQSDIVVFPLLKQPLTMLRWLVIAALLVACTLASPRVSRAQGLVELIGKVNAAEDSGHYAQATALWRRIYDIGEGDPTPLYLLAQSAVKAGDHARAMAALRQALTDGFVPRQPLAKDTSLRPLRTHAQWPALVRQEATMAAGRDTALRRELIALAAEDQRGRAGLDSIFRQFGVPSPQADSAFARMNAIDTVVQARLHAIVAQRGWPGRRMVGDDGAHAAWLITQHMDVAQQRALLPLLQAAVQRGDARPADAALLEDRVGTDGGGLQRYGSQLKPPKPNGEMELYPIDKPECVDKRRAAVKLAPLATYLEHFGVKWEAPKGKKCESRD